MDARSPRKIIGLMSGTSVDGIDAALVEVTGNAVQTGWQLLAFETYPYEAPTRRKILRACHPETSDVRMICELNFELGRLFARAVIHLVQSAGHRLDDIDLIGSHGHTLYHQPPSAHAGEPSTLQIGEPAVIAQETGIPTVADFRVADVAVGGEGAPLVPYVDFLLFRKQGIVRALQNIGGIGNVTYLPEQMEDVLAFDTGPGNMLLDGAMQHFAGQPMDRDGAFASTGRIHRTLLERLMEHPFLRRPPPKSTGREMFGEPFLCDVLSFASEHRISACDTMMTLTAFTADSIYENYRQFLSPQPQEILLSGGGVHNLTLRRRLVERFAPISVRDMEVEGLPGDAKEAVAFAILANEMMAGKFANLPGVTGAHRQVLLGKYTPGSKPLKSSGD